MWVPLVVHERIAELNVQIGFHFFKDSTVDLLIIVQLYLTLKYNTCMPLFKSFIWVQFLLHFDELYNLPESLFKNSFHFPTLNGTVKEHTTRVACRKTK